MIHMQVIKLNICYSYMDIITHQSSNLMSGGIWFRAYRSNSIWLITICVRNLISLLLCSHCYDVWVLVKPVFIGDIMTGDTCVTEYAHYLGTPDITSFRGSSYLSSKLCHAPDSDVNLDFICLETDHEIFTICYIVHRHTLLVVKYSQIDSIIFMAAAIYIVNLGRCWCFFMKTLTGVIITDPVSVDISEI